MTVRVGDSLGQYVIIDQIGKGGMATVFRASQPSLSREVAIKVLPDFFADDPSFHARFRQEAMAIAKLRHPNILTVFDSGETDGVAYIVAELVDGGTLADKLGKPLPLDECVRIAATVGQALDYAHGRGMIHRDIKPSNILLARDGTPILSDFGLARMTGAADGETPARLTATGMALGTPEYMAPEQVTSSVVGPAADIYALAVTLYEMLTGTVPYTADTPIAVIAARLRDPLPLPREKNPALSEAVQNVLLTGLADDPADRYRTAGEMAEALRAASVAASLAPAASAPARSRRMPLVAAAGVVVVAAVAVLVWRGRASPAPSRTSAPPSVASPADTHSKTLNAPPVGEISPLAGAKVEPAGSPAGSPIATTPRATATATKPAAPATPAPSGNDTAQSSGGRDGLPPHGRLLYSIGTSAADLVAIRQARPSDAIVLKDGALELTAGTDTGFSLRLPVDGVGDFVAVLRYTAVEQAPGLTFRFHVTPQGQGHAVRLPSRLRLIAPPTGAPPIGPHVCCQPFDLLIAPQAPGSKSLFVGAEPISVPAAPGEEQVVVVSATGPLIVVWSGGQEIARATDSSFHAGGMNLGIVAARGGGGATLRLRALELYELPASASSPATVTEVPHGKLLFTLADHLSTVAQTRQMAPEQTIAVKDKSLELTAGSTDGWAAATLPVGGISDFVAVIRLAAVGLKPSFQLRFHRGPQGDHVVQIPAYLRLGPPEAGVRAVGPHACCQDFDVLAVPTAGGPTLFGGPLPRAVPAPATEEQVVVIAVQGPLVVVYEGGREIARITLDAPRAGGMSIQVQAWRRQVPAVLRVNALEIYEPAPSR
jgi:serine/threonine protein kinase